MNKNNRQLLLKKSEYKSTKIEHDAVKKELEDLKESLSILEEQQNLEKNPVRDYYFLLITSSYLGLILGLFFITQIFIDITSKSIFPLFFGSLSAIITFIFALKNVKNKRSILADIELRIIKFKAKEKQLNTELKHFVLLLSEITAEIESLNSDKRDDDITGKLLERSFVNLDNYEDAQTMHLTKKKTNLPYGR